MSDTSDINYDQLSSLVNEKLSEIGEHAEAVLILATFSESRGTKRIYRGIGNFFAQKGMVHDWLESWRDKDQAEAIASEIKSSDD